MGYLTCEWGQLFESMDILLPEDTCLAHFVVPDEILICDNVKKTLTAVVITFLDETTSPQTVFNNACDRLDRLLDLLKEPLGDDCRWVEPSSFRLESKVPPDQFLRQVEAIRALIEKGEIIQAVISQPFTTRAPEDPTLLYRALRYINPSPYMFFMHLDETLLVGSSPETMVRLENRVATLRPIAGTRPRGKDRKTDIQLADALLADEKERAEHLMLVDLGRNDLGRVAKTGTVQVTDLMVVERYSDVMHLVSNITCDLSSQYDALDLVSATFPAGTLSGAPKRRAIEVISALEKDLRGAYGGAVGYLSFNGNMDMAITIRTAVIKENTLTVQAGAGIVHDSVPEKELEETINKARSIERALSLLASWIPSKGDLSHDTCDR